ncbi:RHS repeat-associated protein [Chryseobacterium sp. JUb7]|nr:RHS repeat-associated protein [Chryseobacterium sp. JUb7]
MYDEHGRQTRDYLPVPQTSTTNGQIYSQTSGLNPYPVADATNFYTGEKIFTEKVLESSPLERLLQQKSVGSAWSDKPVVFAYDLNTASDHVKKYHVSSTWDSAQKLYINQFQAVPEEYRTGSLIKNTVKDEDGNATIEFKDGSGQTVLVRKVVSTSQNTDTYYVYNEYKQLAYVLPPLASTLASISASTLNDLCYQYQYDSKNRLAEKKLPGKDWEYMVYDKQDRMVLTQDANLRSTANNFLKRGWIFTKYDHFGRVLYTGFFANTADRATMQNSLNSMSVNPGNNESRDNTNPIVQNGENIYYTKNAFPTGSMTILTVNYYDTYPSLPSEVVIPTQIMGQKVLKQFGHSTTGKNTKDLPMASYVKNIEDDSWTKTFVYFDVKGRSIGALSLNHLGGYTKTESELDFAGVTRQTKTYHKRLATDPEKIITQTFEYDSQNRMMKHWHQINGQPQELLTENTYNELSQLTNKKVGNNLQSIDYAYNIRGWMTRINDPAALNGKLFGYEMKYQNGTDGKYNGNISQIDWRTSQDDILKRYSYQYDPLNRLKKATYSEPNSSVPGNDFFNETIDYDLNGNIKSLQRNSKGATGIKEQIDNLTYQYTGNRLATVNDTSTNYRGYPDISGNTIAYDDNGNMKEHKDKGILEIRYNFLDLPTAMKFDQLYFTRGVWQNVNTAFTYRADGTKLKKVYKYSEDSVYKQKITEYLDGFQYEIVSTNSDPLIKFVPTSEGYYNFENNKYIYSYVDHLGNVRVSYFNNGNGAEVLEENNYYPFGLKHEGYNILAGNPAYKYQYNGKELQQETGWNDYGARMYMPELGRWGVMDALSEKYNSYSPFNYAINNPVMIIDPDGNDAKTYTGQDAIDAFIQLRDNMPSKRSSISTSLLSGNESPFSHIDFTKFGIDGPGPKYTAQHYALIQGLSTFANKLFGTPFTLDKLTEDDKQNIFKQSAKKTTAILMYEYASGTGPENRNFYPGDALTEDIKWSNSSARATTMFANDYREGKVKEGQVQRYYIGSSPDKIGISGSIDAHLKGLADQSIWRGGMIYDMQKRGNKLYVKVFDQYTVSSGISRNDKDSFKRSNKITPLGTTTINIHFNYKWINSK